MKIEDLELLAKSSVSLAQIACNNGSCGPDLGCQDNDGCDGDCGGDCNDSAT